MIKNSGKPQIGTRLASMLLDHFFMCFILLIPMIPFIIANAREDRMPSDNLSPGWNLAFLGLLIIYFLKDSFQGRSLAKRIVKLQVVDNKTGEPASVVRCFVRNLTICLWPVEVIVTFFSPHRRIGDLIANTKVVSLEKRYNQFGL